MYDIRLQSFAALRLEPKRQVVSGKACAASDSRLCGRRGGHVDVGVQQHTQVTAGRPEPPGTVAVGDGPATFMQTSTLRTSTILPTRQAHPRPLAQAETERPQQEATGWYETPTMWVRAPDSGRVRRRVQPGRPVESPGPPEKHGGVGLRSLGSGVKVCEATSVCRWSGRGPLGRDSTSHHEQPHLLIMRPGVGVRRRVPLWRGSRCSIRMRCGLLG